MNLSIFHCYHFRSFIKHDIEDESVSCYHIESSSLLYIYTAFWYGEYFFFHLT